MKVVVYLKRVVGVVIGGGQVIVKVVKMVIIFDQSGDRSDDQWWSMVARFSSTELKVVVDVGWSVGQRWSA